MERSEKGSSADAKEDRGSKRPNSAPKAKARGHMPSVILEFPGMLSRECSSPKGQRGQSALEGFSAFCQNTQQCPGLVAQVIITATYEAEIED